jgi:putative membrane protein
VTVATERRQRVFVGGGMMEHEPMVGYEGRQFFGGGPWFWGFGLIGLVIRLAVWAGLILLGMSLFRRMAWRSDGYTRHQKASPLEILKRRYAAGEITREQFDEMRRVLDQPSAAR